MRSVSLICAIESVRDVFVENTRCCASAKAVVDELLFLDDLIRRVEECHSISREDFDKMVGEDKHGNAAMAWDIASAYETSFVTRDARGNIIKLYATLDEAKEAFAKKNGKQDVVGLIIAETADLRRDTFYAIVPKRSGAFDCKWDELPLCHEWYETEWCSVAYEA